MSLLGIADRRLTPRADNTPRRLLPPRYEVSRLQALRDLLPNLQLLEMPANISKSAAPPATWTDSLHSSADALRAYLERNEIPLLPSSPSEFEALCAERREALAQRIVRLFGAGTNGDGLAVSDDE